ncbi:MAG TPA: hypothetical protein VGJ48_14110 [Pyrinomonadaceae bacterium]|jgi:hypothetical protein
MKAKLVVAIRLAILTVLYFLCFAFVSGALLRVASEQPTPTDAGGTLIALFAVSFLNTAVLAYLILRSRWAGWKLVLAIFVVFYGVMTVMSQIETAYFLTRLPPGLLPRLFLAGAIIAALFSALAVPILGKGRRAGPDDESEAGLKMPVRQWIVKLALILIAYVIIYFTFGYFIAWKNDAVRAYYGGNDPGSLLAQMRIVLRDTPMLLPLQAVRGLLWTALAVLVIRMMKGEWWEAGFAVALSFAVLMNSQLLLPNPLMPQEVRMVHLLETASSNFLFGWLVVIVLFVWRPSGRKSAYQ